MKKKTLGILLALVLVLVLPAVTVFAEGKTYLNDTAHVLSEEELTRLEKKASDIYTKHGVGLYLYITEEPLDPDPETAADAYSVRNIFDDAALLLLTSTADDTGCVYATGRAKNIFTQEQLDGLWEAFDGESAYAYGADAYLTGAAKILSANGVQPIPGTAAVGLLNDEAELLTDSERAAVQARLQEVSDAYDFDVAVLTVNGTGGKTISAFADDYFDYNGLGRGTNHDGALLVLDMVERDWYICTTGRGYEVLNDQDIQNIGKQFVSKLSNGDYEEAFLTYADQCEAYLKWAEEGFPEGGDPAEPKKRPFVTPGRIFVWLASPVGAGAIAGNKAKRSARKELQTVHRKSDAGAYREQQGIELTNTQDIFLYSNVIVTVLPPPSDNSSNRPSSGGFHSGGSIHVGSSGSFHGGGGGKF